MKSTGIIYPQVQTPVSETDVLIGLTGTQGSQVLHAVASDINSASAVLSGDDIVPVEEEFQGQFGLHSKSQSVTLVADKTIHKTDENSVQRQSILSKSFPNWEKTSLAAQAYHHLQDRQEKMDGHRFDGLDNYLRSENKNINQRQNIYSDRNLFDESKTMDKEKRQVMDATREKDIDKDIYGKSQNRHDLQTGKDGGNRRLNDSEDDEKGRSESENVSKKSVKSKKLKKLKEKKEKKHTDDSKLVNAFFVVEAFRWIFGKDILLKLIIGAIAGVAFIALISGRLIIFGNL